MKFWLLRPVNWNQPTVPSEWKPWFDKAFGFVVLAPNEETARWLAAESAGDEGRAPWQDPTKTTCSVLDETRYVEGVIIRDFAAA